jgi:hypothetical protein
MDAAGVRRVCFVAQCSVGAKLASVSLGPREGLLRGFVRRIMHAHALAPTAPTASAAGLLPRA